MYKAVIIQHIGFEDLGSWEELLAKEYQLDYVDCTQAVLSNLKNKDIDLLVVLGGPIGVYQEQEFPFITKEIALLKERLALDLPTLGICLGSQLVARALGAKVYPNHKKEIGWYSLDLTEKGKKSCVRHLGPDHTSMFHWHGDTFDLPNGAELLASTPVCRNQIFSYGKNGIAFQCHPEVTAQHLERWWIGNAGELGQQNLLVNPLREESQKLAPKLQSQASKCLQEWLSSLQKDRK